MNNVWGFFLLTRTVSSLIRWFCLEPVKYRVKVALILETAIAHACPEV